MVTYNSEVGSSGKTGAIRFNKIGRKIIDGINKVHNSDEPLEKKTACQDPGYLSRNMFN
ncbi:hypothetical protein [Erwinia pyrifoliae]|uniref:hypothetical protein n=1 Tax=Erwinia pyrifoliae TaxID=79967 RepID=UPI0022020286|nr:hypothetical protein [Erwinia pyrifoliae]UWS31620.1 hypothetical protein NYP81_09380 [Erwinia pyrifoliae]